MAGETGPAHPHVSGRSGAAPASRLVCLDNLKVLLVAAIIAAHAVLGYSTLEVWTYTAVREVTLAPATEAVLLVTLLPFGLFVIAVLFLVSGLLTAPSVQRKGPGRFASDRLVRLGVPFLVYVLLVQPTVVYLLAHPLGAAPGSFWQEYLGAEGRLDTGPLWFVGVLLVFSLGYAAWTAVRPRGAQDRPRRPITVPVLLALTALAAPASFVVRLVYPYGSEAGFTDLNLWQWPACLAVFALGVAGAARGWLAAVPQRLCRQCRAVTLVCVGLMAGLVLASAASGDPDGTDAFLGGWSWQAATFAAVEAALDVFGAVWLLGVAQRHLDRPVWRGRELSRSAFGAFILQTPVLLGLALLLRPVPFVAEAKAIALATAGVAVSFALAWLLVEKVPGVDRVL